MTQRFVLMGVSGCGKTSVGQALAAEIGITFFDGDDLHPAENIVKMSRGEPLNDADRAPWLAEVGRVLAGHDGPIAIGCSALKRSYRDIIRENAAGPVTFLHLAAPRAVLAARVADRPGHFMPPSLLDSQFAALEALHADEQGAEVNIDQPLAAVVADARRHITQA